MKLWQFEILERYPPFDNWSVYFSEVNVKGSEYRAKYGCPGIGSVYLFFSKELVLKECMGTLEYYFSISPVELKWDLQFITNAIQVKNI